MSDEVPRMVFKDDTSERYDSPATIQATPRITDDSSQLVGSASMNQRLSTVSQDEGQSSSQQDELSNAELSDNAFSSTVIPKETAINSNVWPTTCSKPGRGANRKCGKPIESIDVGVYMRCSECRRIDQAAKRRSLNNIAEGRGVRKHLGKRKGSEDVKRSGEQRQLQVRPRTYPYYRLH